MILVYSVYQKKLYWFHGFTIKVSLKICKFFNRHVPSITTKNNHTTGVLIVLIVLNFQYLSSNSTPPAPHYNSLYIQICPEYKKIYVGYPKSRLGSVRRTTNYCLHNILLRKKIIYVIYRYKISGLETTNSIRKFLNH